MLASTSFRNLSTNGASGYRKGTYAQDNARSFASPSGLRSYPGAQDALGNDVWIAFYPEMQLQEIELKNQPTRSVPLVSNLG